MTIYLNGIVKCGHCGSNITIKPDCRTKDVVNISFICGKKNQTKTNCDNPTIRARKITEIVLEDLRKQCQNIIFGTKELEETFAVTEAEINTEKYKIQKEIDKIGKKIEKLDIQINAIYNDKLEGILKLDDFLKIYENKNKEKENLIKEQEELQKQLGKQENAKAIDYEDLRKYANEFLQMESPTKEVIRNLIESITISKGPKVKIKYKFSKV